MSIIKKLVKIQSELKAHKGQTNKFGGYQYRSAEDILEAVKPLLAENEVSLTISDELLYIGDRYYVEATAVITDGEQEVSVKAQAREEESKKGMDSSQITGSTSSYARKYALNGLFCIDDTKDSDATNDHSDKKSSSRPKGAQEFSNAANAAKENVMDKAVAYIKSQSNKQVAFDNIIKKYGGELSEKQQAGLKKFVR
jgi:hypothetical protein